MLNGIDIASWQGNIDVSKVPADFVIIKATGGGGGGFGYVNPYCDSRFQLAKKAGKLLGVYHYAHEAGFQGSPIDEADFFLKHARGYLNGDAIPILDWESDNKTDVQWALKWLKRVEERTGIKPWFYTYTSVLQLANFKPIADADYGLWIANYGTDAAINGYRKPNPPISPGFPMTACFQYSSNTYLPNYGSRLDANVFYGDAKAWRAYATPKGKEVAESKPVAPKPVPKPEQKGKLKMKTVKLNSDVYLRTKPDRNSASIALLKKGSKVNFDDVVLSQGYIWGAQPRTDKYKVGYIALGKIDSYGAIS